jgi:catechol 2,3-dioxygenase
MGATTQDIFGAGTEGEPASAGSYGDAPSSYRLPADIAIGPVRLQVSDLGRSVDFYERLLGLEPVRTGPGAATLAAHDGGATLVELQERPGARPLAKRSRLGLYHFAILVPDRPTLGRFLRHASATGIHIGSSDHLVSEALYLSDPDGLVIEVYADRPRELWRRRGRELMMATDPLDAAGVIGAGGGAPWAGMPAGTVMGHMHLYVGDLAQANAFYSEAMGLDRIGWSYPGALFLSAGGYHHHLGTNTWVGPNAKPAAEDEAHMLEWTLDLPTAADLNALGQSLAGAGYAAESSGCELVTRDPWGTAVRVRAAT